MDSTNINIAQQLEEIRIAVENSNSNYFLTVWIPIIVVFIGAFIAHIFNLIEKKRQRENLRFTIALWLRESLQPIEGFIHMLQMYIAESQSATVLDSKRPFTTTFDLQCIKDFSIDKMSDALVARLKVSKNERIKLVQNFYDLYDFSKNMSVMQNQVLEGHSDYNRKINGLKREFDNCHMEYLCLINNNLLMEDITDPERQFFNKTQVLFLEMWDQVAKDGGVFRRDILHKFIREMSEAYLDAPQTRRVLEANMSCNNIRIVLHNMESLHKDMIQVNKTILNSLLVPSKEHLSRLASFYEQHKIKSIFSFSNKLS